MAGNQNPNLLLKQLPTNILYATLFKTDTVTLCRLRRTCSLLNNFVEEHREKLARRPHLGIDVDFGLRRDGTLCICSPGLRFDPYYGWPKNRCVQPLQYKASMSAISLKTVHFDYRNFIGDPSVPSVELKQFFELQKEKFLCTNLYMFADRAEIVIYIAKKIENMDEFRVTSGCRNPVEFSEKCNAADATGFKWTIVGLGANFSQNLFCKVKNLLCVIYDNDRGREKLQFSVLHGFLWDLYQSDGDFKLQCVQLPLARQGTGRNESFLFNRPEFEMPPMITLATIRDLPRGTPRADFPNFLRLLDLDNKYAIILEFTFSSICTIFFVDKSCGTEFDAILYIVGKASSEVAKNMERSYREEYVTATEERKQKIIRKAFLSLGSHAYALRICDI